LTKLRDTEKAKLEADKQAYIDPAKAETAREEGNTFFKVCHPSDDIAYIGIALTT
jgi:stress-induced-phosphoprotein 1